jgi:ferredoxin like protein
MEMALSMEQKLALNVYKLDKEAHITIDKSACRRCGDKYCLRVCPAHLFTLDDKGDVDFNYEGCLECGTCLISCIECALSWSYPRGGFGVEYRFG